jgi:uncharacterized protein YbbC (DUF1343 family)/CubicO group peptidase (beta-lactamase class C family)
MFPLWLRISFLLLLCTLPVHAAPLPSKEPATLGFLPERLAVADGLVTEAVEKKGVPGAVLLIGRGGAIAFRKAYGLAGARPELRAMTTDTIFDVASLTKPLVSAALMKLIEERKIELDAPVSRYLPAFSKEGKAQITIRHLMTHGAGLKAGGAYAGRKLTTAQIIEEIAASPQLSPPGAQFLYSDFSFITLGAVVEAVTGQSLNDYCRETIFGPLGMNNTGFLPTAPGIASTSSGDDVPDSRGKVHDPTAAALGGVAGHAGIFSTADDLARFCQMILNGGELDGVRILKPQTVALWTSKQSPFIGSARALGWDLDSAYSIRGALAPGSFGHTGFTGTSLWIDPQTRTFVILLTNAVHAKPAIGAITPLRRLVSSAVAASFADWSPGPGRLAALPASLEDFVSVQTGLEVLSAENFKRLEGRNIGVVCNHTAVDRQGRHLVDLLTQNKALNVVALFAPEHGIRGEVDATVDNSVDAQTGLKIYSLYNTQLPPEQRYRPSDEMLRGIDTLVFDIQDIGTRYYTYISTLGYILEAAAPRKIKVIVLDRPNPLGGLATDGPLIENELQSFVGYHEMPIQHGLTIGEMALLFNSERKIGADLEIVKMPNWNRRLMHDQIGLPWVNPSPNIRNVRQAALYPGIGYLEFMPISVGRGTDTPFEIVGAPWIDGVALAQNLNARRLPGISFTPTRFTPTASKHKGALCGGVQIHLWDRRIYRPVEIGIHIADALARLYPDQMNATTLELMHKLIGSKTLPQQIAAGTPPETIIAAWQDDAAKWRTRRTPFLLYP